VSSIELTEKTMCHISLLTPIDHTMCHQ
jgi:hypothetical protein